MLDQGVMSIIATLDGSEVTMGSGGSRLLLLLSNE